MFRFEVHLRITDETGQHIQHMTSGSGDPSDGFLLSSLFENNKNIVVGGANPLSKFGRDPFDVSSHSRSVLSSLVSDELCCSLVDDLVSHATECLNDTEDLYIGDHSVWKHGYDWTILGGSERKCGENTCTFTAHVSGFSAKEFVKHQKPISDPDSCSSSTEDVQAPCQVQSVGQFSDSEFSWGSTDSSCFEGEREENDKLWDLLTSSTDPYHPLHFTACLSSAVPEKSKTQVVLKAWKSQCISVHCIYWLRLFQTRFWRWRRRGLMEIPLSEWWPISPIEFQSPSSKLTSYISTFKTWFAQWQHTK